MSKKAAAAVAATGGYVDETLFRKVFGLDLAALEWLNNSGLLSFVSDHYAAHDELRLLQRKRTVRLTNLARKYWSEQVTATPQHLWACRSLLSFVGRSGYDRLIDSVILEAARTLIQINDSGTDSTGDNRNSQLWGSRLPRRNIYCGRSGAHRATRRGRYICSSHWRNRLSKNTNLQLNLILSERYLWSGDFDKAESLVKSIFDMNERPELKARAHLNLGLIFFFKGLWDRALSELTSINRALLKPRTAGWMQMIEGTIRGIRGQGTSVLQHAIQLLQASNDEVGLAIGLNNLGELRWRTGDFRSALVCLTKALELCRVRGDRATELDAERNLVNLYLRIGETKSFELTEHITKLNALLSEVPDKTEHMQAWNTLATVALFQGEQALAAEYIAKAHQYTKNNVEYHIYTLVNESFLNCIQGKLAAEPVCLPKLLV